MSTLKIIGLVFCLSLIVIQVIVVVLMIIEYYKFIKLKGKKATDIELEKLNNEHMKTIIIGFGGLP